jgi:hypothetical protein
MYEGRRGWKIPAVELSLVLLLFIINEVECAVGRERNKTYKNYSCSATSRDGLEIEIKFFLEANFVGGGKFRLNSPKRKSFMGGM